MKENKDVIINDKMSNKMEIHKCVCCYDAPCLKMYKNIDPERIIRIFQF